MIHLAQSGDNRLVLACNEKLPADIARVEYYRDLKLFMLVYEGNDEEELNRLMPHEISEDIAKIVTTYADIIVVVKDGEEEAYGYIAPLVQIGL